MPPSNDTIREIAKAFRRHVDAAALEKIVNELLDVPANKSSGTRLKRWLAS